LIDYDLKRNDTDNDKYGDVLSPRHIDYRGPRQFNEHEEFNDTKHEKDFERADVEQDENSSSNKRQHWQTVQKTCISVKTIVFE
jgi:hypothetical protein